MEQEQEIKCQVRDQQEKKKVGEAPEASIPEQRKTHLASLRYRAQMHRVVLPGDVAIDDDDDDDGEEVEEDV
ncbi:unnamed protein product [Diplocarpon coronariae]|nr:hypothetical protein JHW43_004787 [Diplocarpon mali]